MAKPFKEPHINKMITNLNQVQAQIIRGLRYVIVLNILKMHPMHGYGIINLIRKNFGIYLGPSSVYPLLKDLENWEYVESTWEIKKYRPRKVYKLTAQGHDLLNYMEHSVGHVLMGFGIAGTAQEIDA